MIMNVTKLNHTESECLNLHHMCRNCSFWMKINYKFYKRKKTCAAKWFYWQCFMFFVRIKLIKLCFKLWRKSFKFFFTFQCRKSIQGKQTFLISLHVFLKKKMKQWVSLWNLFSTRTFKGTEAKKLLIVCH